MEARAALEADLLAAHASGDTGALIALYSRAADMVPEAAAFYLTHAMVFALEAGDGRAQDLRARLVAMGCEAPD